MSLLPLEISQGELTPYVLLDAYKRVIVIKGRCIPENPSSYFSPILDWVDRLSEMQNIKLDMICKIQYFNTSSAKYLLEIFRRLDKYAHQNKNTISILWYFETDDEDMQEAGEYFSELVKLPFKIIEVSEDEFDR